MSFELQFIVNGTFGASGFFHMKGQIGSQGDIKGKISPMSAPLFQNKEK